MSAAAQTPGPDRPARALAPSVPIRSRLLLLVLSVLVPGLLGLSWFVAAAHDAERAANLRALRDTARAMSLAVELELHQRAALARTLAQSHWLDAAPDIAPDDLRAFHEAAQRALGDLGGGVELRPGAGGTPTPSALVEPVVRGGRKLLELVLAMPAGTMQRVVDTQALPPGWIAVVLDNRGRVVARSPRSAGFIGNEAAGELRRQISGARQGGFETVVLDGQRMSGYFSTTAQGWTYVSAMPVAQYAGLLPRSVRQVTLGSLVLLGLAVAAALLVARSIAGPVVALKDAAAQVHAGRPMIRPPTGIRECDEVAAALESAGQTIQRQRHDLELQVARAVQTALEAERRAAQAQRAQALGRLTGGVAHDFNNLLGVIGNSTSLVERHAAAPQLELPLSSIRRAVESGSRLTRHLLRVAGRGPVRPRTLQLEPWLHDVRDLLQSVLGRRIAVSADAAAETRAVRVDAGELELALIDLGLNARDAMPGGGTLQLHARNATAEEARGLPARPGGGYVLIGVADNGPGIEPAVAAHAFDPFFTTKDIGKGTGLGLSQVLGFCTQAGGTARLQSKAGHGTTVSLLLPAADAAPQDDPPHADAPDVASLAGARVLLVEDNEELARISAALLESHGVVVEHAADAAQALQRLASPNRFDIVLSDIVMPGEIDGLALARRLRREQPELPVVLVSGYSEAAAAGDVAILRKPCRDDELLQALAQALRDGAQAHRPAAT